MSDELTTAFAENLRKHRRAIGLTQIDLAKKAYLSLSYVGILERGEKSPTLETVGALAAALGINPVKLLKH